MGNKTPLRQCGTTLQINISCHSLLLFKKVRTINKVRSEGVEGGRRCREQQEDSPEIRLKNNGQCLLRHNVEELEVNNELSEASPVRTEALLSSLRFQTHQLSEPSLLSSPHLSAPPLLQLNRAFMQMLLPHHARNIVRRFQVFTFRRR